MEQATDGEACAQSRLRIENLCDEIGKEFNGRKDELIPLLQSVQRELGFLPEQALREIAHLTRLPAAKVFGTATFYSQFRLKPIGKYLVRVCRGTACHVRGGSRIQREVEKQLGINPGESTTDLKFALETVACIGACAQAPTMVVDNEAYGKVTTKKVGEILKQRE
jgi:NADH-quinone oxidoreductase subunit E